MFVRDSCSKQLDSDRLAADVPYLCVMCLCVWEERPRSPCKLQTPDDA
jgi:hypothetical protein